MDKARQTPRLLYKTKIRASMPASGIKAWNCFSFVSVAFSQVSCFSDSNERVFLEFGYSELMPLAVALIIARTWVRRMNCKKFSADDYWIMFAAVRISP